MEKLDEVRSRSIGIGNNKKGLVIFEYYSTIAAILIFFVALILFFILNAFFNYKSPSTLYKVSAENEFKREVWQILSLKDDKTGSTLLEEAYRILIEMDSCRGVKPEVVKKLDSMLGKRIEKLGMTGQCSCLSIKELECEISVPLLNGEYENNIAPITFTLDHLDKKLTLTFCYGGCP